MSPAFFARRHVSPVEQTHLKIYQFFFCVFFASHRRREKDAVRANMGWCLAYSNWSCSLCRRCMDNTWIGLDQKYYLMVAFSRQERLPSFSDYSIKSRYVSASTHRPRTTKYINFSHLSGSHIIYYISICYSNNRSVGQCGLLDRFVCHHRQRISKQCEHNVRVAWNILRIGIDRRTDGWRFAVFDRRLFPAIRNTWIAAVLYGHHYLVHLAQT